MADPSRGLPVRLPTLPLLLGLSSLPAMAQEEPPPPQGRSLVVALELGGTLGALRHPAAVLPPTPNGFPRSLASRSAAQYIDKADRFEAQRRDFTPPGFSVWLSGPSAGASLGVRL
jgi:hypothetical protein